MAAMRLRAASRLGRLFSELRVSQSSLRPARRLKSSLTSGEASRAPAAAAARNAWRPISTQPEEQIVEGGKL